MTPSRRDTRRRDVIVRWDLESRGRLERLGEDRTGSVRVGAPFAILALVSLSRRVAGWYTAWTLTVGSPSRTRPPL